MRQIHPLHFQRATLAEIPLLLPMVQEFYAGEHIPFSENNSRQGLHELLHQPALGSVWLINREAECLGYFVLTHGFILEFHGRHLVLDEFFLRPPFRAQGYGRTVLRQVEEIARAEGVGILRLEVDEASRAEALYTRAGFARHARRTMTKLLA